MTDASLQRTSAPSPLSVDARLRERVTEAVIAQGGFRHEALNAFLRSRLAGRDAQAGALFAEPVIEGTASYVSSGRTPASLKGELLHRDLVAALTAGVPGDDYRFDYPAYAHQLEAWRILAGAEPRSVLVTSGTGSGKTECFLVPMLDDLAREAAREGRLSGVRALMLYPLNALIASQEERLRRWTAPFGGRIRFGLYNGLMKDRRSGHHDAPEESTPEQVLYRGTLRRDPPPILVTNNTMLEYMTIRRQDQPLLERSQDKLRWIVIDEAHSYVGSAAAEVSLLLRRVLQAFGVEAGAVRFVATSATIGGSGEGARRDLQAYLAALAGVPVSQVHVVCGEREPVRLPVPGASELAISPRHPAVQALVRAAERGAVPLPTVARHAQACGTTAERLLETLAGHDGAGERLLPFRVHKFVRAVPGLWSCLNPGCTGAAPEGWQFGAVLFQRDFLCPHCASPAFELLTCRECGEPWLNAFDHGDRVEPQPIAPDRDEFAAASAREAEGEEEDGEETPDPDVATQVPLTRLPGVQRLIATREMPQVRGVREVRVEATTGALPERRSDGVSVWMSDPTGDGSCPHCRAAPRSGSSPLSPFRFGAPFLIQNAAPTMLEGVDAAAPGGETRELPAEGRRLLSFTDSRQGVARFAANLETLSERAYVRAFIYHMVQQEAVRATPDARRRAELQEEIDKLRPLAAASAMIPDMIAKLETDLAGGVGSAKVAWPDAVKALAADPMTCQWIRAVWDRDAPFQGDMDLFAEFLLLRELARRPRRANAVETLGLATMSFPALDALSEAAVPIALREAGVGLPAWRDFLYRLIDTPVRQQFAVSMPGAAARWLLPPEASSAASLGRDRTDAAQVTSPGRRLGRSAGVTPYASWKGRSGATPRRRRTAAS